MDRTPEQRLEDITTALDEWRRDLADRVAQEERAHPQAFSALSPPVVITCGFDGVIQRVALDEPVFRRLVGEDLRQALRQAVAGIQWCPPYSSERRVGADHQSVATDETLAQLAEWKGDLLAPDALEVSGSAEGRAVVIDYRGRRPTQLAVKESWSCRATVQDIERAFIQASQAAMETLNTMRRARG